MAPWNALTPFDPPGVKMHVLAKLEEQDIPVVEASTRHSLDLLGNPMVFSIIVTVEKNIRVSLRSLWQQRIIPPPHFQIRGILSIDFADQAWHSKIEPHLRPAPSSHGSSTPSYASYSSFSPSPSLVYTALSSMISASTEAMGIQGGSMPKLLLPWLP